MNKYAQHTTNIFHQIPVSGVPFAIIFMLFLTPNIFALPHIDSNPIKILAILFNSMISKRANTTNHFRKKC